MKKTFQIFIISIFGISNAQVGINTETPQADLHVEGSIQLTKELRTGGDAVTAGDAGNQGQFLTSQGEGTAPTWITPDEINIPTLSTSAVRSELSGTYSGSSFHEVIFTSVPLLDNTKVSYNSSNGVFTVLKPGWYQITAFLHYDLSGNAPGATAGTATTFIRNDTWGSEISAHTTNHPERTPDVYHNMTGIDYFGAGDRVKIIGAHTQPYRFKQASITIIFFGE